MSDSPQSNPKDVEQGVQSPDEDNQMNDPQDPHSGGLSYEVEVKEQDRWLPIANGMSYSLPFLHRDSRVRACCSAHSSLRRMGIGPPDDGASLASALPLNRPPHITRPCLTIPHRPSR